MANPARQKGTAAETELLGQLRRVFGPDVHRAPLRGIHDHGDFVGTPWLVECKSTKVPAFLRWARQAREKTQPHAWWVAWHGDRRTADGASIVYMPLELALELASAWLTYVHREPPCNGESS